ncbi:MAG: hypothetical protein QM736_06325, partial [Vicinamibacterales bacterium]
VEYRLPLRYVERGHGTLPLLLRSVHASLFADMARVSSEGNARAVSGRAFGAELSADAVAGYSLPFVATVGASWGRAGTGAASTRIYARIGRAF